MPEAVQNLIDAEEISSLRLEAYQNRNPRTVRFSERRSLSSLLTNQNKCVKGWRTDPIRKYCRYYFVMSGYFVACWRDGFDKQGRFLVGFMVHACTSLMRWDGK